MSIPMKIANPNARMIKFVNDFFEWLENVDFGDFREGTQGRRSSSRNQVCSDLI